MTFIIYSLSDGSIEKTLSVPSGDLTLNVADGFSAIIDGGAGDDSKSYVDITTGPHQHTAKASLNLQKPPAIVADGVDTVTISDIPAGVFVTWPDGEREEVTGGVVEFATTQPGAYPLAFDGVQYLSEVVTIEANI